MTVDDKVAAWGLVSARVMKIRPLLVSSASIAIIAAIAVSSDASAQSCPPSCTGNDVFEADTAGAVGTGFLQFSGTATLDATATDAVDDGYQFFIDTSQLNASANRAISGGTQYFANSTTLNASEVGSISGGAQHIGDSSVLNASAASAISGGIQTIANNGTLNALVTGAVSGGEQRITDDGLLNILAVDALTTGTQISFSKATAETAGGILRLNGFSTTIGTITTSGLPGAGVITNDAAEDSVLTVHSAGLSAFSGTIQDGSGGGRLALAMSGGTLTLSGANSYTGGTTVSGGILRAGGAASLAGNTDYVVNSGILDLGGFDLIMSSLSGAGGTVEIGTAALTVDQSTNTAYAGALSGSGEFNKSGSGALTLSGNSSGFSGNTTISSGRLVLEGSLGGFLEVHNDGVLEAAAANAVSAGLQIVEDNGTLDATAANAINGGTQYFRDDSVLNASAANAVSGGNQTFSGHGTLNATVADAVTGGFQLFLDTSTLNASATNAISDGSRQFSGNSTLNILAADAISGGTQNFFDSSNINANVAGAISAGGFLLGGDSSLNANVTGAVTGGSLTLNDNARVNVLANDGLAAAVSINFDNSSSGLGGIVALNGHSTTIGRINSAASSSGIITNDGDADSVLTVNNSATAATFSGIIQDGDGDGRLGLTLAAGTLTLEGLNTYTGGTTINGGSLRSGALGAFVSNTAYTVNGGLLDLGGEDLIMSSLSGTGGEIAMGTTSLNVDQSTDTSYAGILSGTDVFIKAGTGRLTLSGDSSAFGGETSIIGGTLAIDGALGGNVEARIGGALTGTGRIAGSADLQFGGILEGRSGQTLRIDQNVILNEFSLVNVALGTPTSTAMFDVGGGLTLGGTLNVSDAGGFGAGVYRLFDYGGALTGDLAIGETPSGVVADDLEFQTAVAGQVNLISTAGAELSFWDGGDTALHDNDAIDGGAGFWRADGRNWTQADGALNGRFMPNPTFAVFQNTGGTVTVDASAGAIGVTGLQFTADGYRLEGDSIALQGASGKTVIKVGDGSAASADTTTTIASALTGASTLVKSELGRLVLAGTNAYTGGTRIDAGVLSVSSDANLGAASGDLVFHGGALETTASFDTDRSVLLDAAGGFDVASGTMLGLAGTVSGSGDLVKRGAGTLILTGPNSYAGDTLIETGILVGNANSIRGSLANAGTVIFDQSGDASFAGSVGGFGGTDGAAIKRGGGALRLAGLSTLDWTVETGNLIADAARFSGNAAILTDGALTFDQNANAIYAGVFTGAGSVNLTGSAALTLTGQSIAFTGATTIQGGRLVVNGTLGGDVEAHIGAALTGTGRITGTADLAAGGVLIGTVGQTLRIDGDVLLGGTSVVNVALGVPSSTALFDVGGDLALGGTLNVTDAGGFGMGVYRLFDYGGALSGDLEIDGTPSGVGADNLALQTAVSGQVNLVSSAGAELSFWDGGDVALHDNDAVDGGSGAWRADGRNWTQADGALNGPFQPNPTFAIFQSNGGLVTVDTSAGAIGVIGMQFAADGYRIEDGSIALEGAGGQTIIQVGDHSAAGADMTTTIATELTGASALVKTDLGTLILTGTNSYTGDTRIDAGILQIGDGGATGSIQGDVVNAGELRFARSDAVTFDGAISGAGTLRQMGDGLIDLTGNSSGFTGSTFVDAGTLAVSGTLGGSLAVLTGGRLQGTGTVGSTIVRGTIAPGNSIGTLNIAGDINFLAGSVYEVEANAAGQADSLVASGTATIEGGTVRVLAGTGTYQPKTDYMILSAGQVTGTFANVTSNMAFLDPSLSYDTGHVYLHLTRNDVFFADVAGTPNQVAAGQATEALGRDNPVFDAAVTLSAQQARNGFDQLSGEIHPSARTAMLEGSRFLRNAVWDRLRSATDDVPGGMWGQAIGSWGHTSGDGNAARLGRSTGGLLMGVDALAGESVRLGAVWGYDRTNIDVPARASSGKIDSFHLGAYAGGQWDRLSIRAGVSYSWQDIHTTRGAAFAGFADTLRGGYSGGTFQAFGETGYAIDLGASRVEPFANLAYVRSHSVAFTETGGDASLSGAKAASDVFFSTFGLRGDTRFQLGRISANLTAGAGWRHAFADTTSLTMMRFASGGDAFAIRGVPVARNAAILDAGLGLALSGHTNIAIGYSGQFGNALSDQTAKATLSVSF